MVGPSLTVMMTPHVLDLRLHLLDGFIGALGIRRRSLRGRRRPLGGTSRRLRSSSRSVSLLADLVDTPFERTEPAVGLVMRAFTTAMCLST